MNNCNEYILKMNMYLDGELPANQLSDLMEHIDSCENCSHRFEGLKVTAFEMRQMEQPVPDMLHSAIMRHVRENSAENQRRRWVQKLIPVAACALFLLMAGTGTFGKLTGIYLFGGGNKTDDVVADGAPGLTRSVDDVAMPENFTASDPATSGGSDAQANNDLANADNGLYAKAERTEDVPGVSAAQYGSSDGKQLGAISDTVITLPTLYVGESARFYVVSTGTVDILPLFPAGDTFSGDTEGEYYCLVRDSEQTWDTTASMLVENGITVFENVENLPDTSDDAKFGMVVYFKTEDTY